MKKYLNNNILFCQSLYIDTLPDSISSNCSKCSERQQYGAEKVTHFLIDNKPEKWEELEKIYDPSGTYRMEYLSNKVMMETGGGTETETNEKEQDKNGETNN